LQIYNLYVHHNENATLFPISFGASEPAHNLMLQANSARTLVTRAMRQPPGLLMTVLS
jgi:hypothetical protein